MADGVLLWKWRNDPTTRRMFRKSHVIPWQEHAAWLAHVLQDPSKTLLIARDAAGPVGVLRFDAVGKGHAEVSINVNPERRGRGLGKAILAAGCRYAFGELHLAELSAGIKPDNASSIAIFERVGFHFLGVREGLNTYGLTAERFRQPPSASAVP